MESIAEDQWGPWEVCDFCGIQGHYVQEVALPGGKIARRIGPKITYVKQADGFLHIKTPEEAAQAKAFADTYNLAKSLGFLRD